MVCVCGRNDRLRHQLARGTRAHHILRPTVIHPNVPLVHLSSHHLYLVDATAVTPTVAAQAIGQLASADRNGQLTLAHPAP